MEQIMRKSNLEEELVKIIESIELKTFPLNVCNANSIPEQLRTKYA